ncbi:DUF1461 domain-containing protein [Alcanivorax sp. S6407]|uniref:lipoprotein intramolecular transacylase Lit n=1 Tax=Alcanivorax sp. S6407 TaxID=2926424 RepID=UPI001FF49601|nr:DUF1461 domain-containing protein [Alcanivorax sp. S6407]MCK0152440.1 DUF1461 domain-containing protein [Alcanivorax sp. S6407]
MTKKALKSPNAATLVWFAYAVITVLLAVLSSWALYSKADYGYPFWYDQLDIREHIQQYGPQNRFKSGLELLPAEQHWRAFEQIRDAVHDHGEGLATILYQPPGQSPRTLLHAAEVQHLQDVANLIDQGRWLFLVLLVLWLPAALALRRLGQPSMRRRLVAAVITLGAVLAWLGIAGPTEVFYQFHLWLFPADHQWFFYWQDSLMSTLMKAPVLFGGIAAVIALGALLLLPAFYWLGLIAAARLHRQKTQRQKNP